MAVPGQYSYFRGLLLYNTSSQKAHADQSTLQIDHHSKQGHETPQRACALLQSQREFACNPYLSSLFLPQSPRVQPSVIGAMNRRENFPVIIEIINDAFWMM